MNNVRKIRRAKDLTQQQLADLLGITKTYISLIEKGKIPNPSIYRCYGIAKALNVELDDIFPSAV